MKKPLIVVNLKSYKEAVGKKAFDIARKITELTKNTKTQWVVCPQFVDLFMAKYVDIPVFSQHTDPFEPGRGTGYVTPFALKTWKVKGSLLNHSEHRLKFSELKKTAELLKKYGLKVIACANSVREASRIAKEVKPDYVAIEPPELIGTGIPVSEAKPEVVEKGAKAVKKYGVGFLCGAGISSGKDVQKALELGADGVLVASAIVKAKSKAKIIKEFVKGAENGVRGSCRRE